MSITTKFKGGVNSYKAVDNILYQSHTIEGNSIWTRAGLYYNNKGLLLLHEEARYTLNINETKGLGIFDFYVDTEFYETIGII